LRCRRWQLNQIQLFRQLGDLGSGRVGCEICGGSHDSSGEATAAAHSDPG
jgi:hypothetical protein